MCYCDYDSAPEFFSDSTRTARKAHKCCECKGPINAGERYKIRAGKWDGEFSTYKQCIACTDLEDYVKAHVPCMCRTFTELFEDVSAAVEYAEQEGRIPGFRFAILRKKVLICRRKHLQKSRLMVLSSR